MRSLFSLVPWLLFSAITAVLATSWAGGGIVADLLGTSLTGAERVQRLQEFFRGTGALAPIAYVGFVMAEVVVAPIPGLLLYAPGGLIFGPWMGGLLALIGNILGAGIACGLTRSLGNRWLSRIAGHQSIDTLQLALEQRGWLVIVLLRLNPLTSSDLLSYAAGFTRLPIHHVMLATGLGMAPLCFAQSWLSDSVFNRWPHLLWPLLILGVLYLIVVVVILSKLLRQLPATEAVPVIGTPPHSAP